MKKLISYLITFFWVSGVFAVEKDSVFTYSEFMNLVKKHHPVAKMADIQNGLGKASVSSSRGAFDPDLVTGLNQKYFNGKEYYSHLNAGLEIPTWFGIEFKSGFEQNRGMYLNPEETTSGQGLLFSEISVPVGKGLFIDKRRAELRKARVFLQSQKARRRQMLNKLFLEAGKSYWNWFMAYEKMKARAEMMLVTKRRYENVAEEASFENIPSIDTVEAGIQFRNRKISFLDARREYRNATAELNVFLWGDGVVPLEVKEHQQPPAHEVLSSESIEDALDLLTDSLIENHPRYQEEVFKKKSLEIDRKLSRENLKPQLDLKYNFLSESIGSAELPRYSTNDYQWGLQFSFPVLLRRERGELRWNELKLEEQELKVKWKRESLEQNYRVAVNDFKSYLQQLKECQKLHEYYQKLLQGEYELFDAGESSLFMVNSREKGALNARLKLIEVIAKTRQSLLMVQYAGGEFSD